MKKKLLILSAAIGLILACFPFTLCAEEDPQSDLGISSPPAYYELDEYFWDNYTPLPYIESDGSQYINTGISPNENLDFEMVFGGFDSRELDVNSYLFGSSVTNNAYEAYINYSNGRLLFHYMSGYANYSTYIDSTYNLYTYKLSDGRLTLNNSVISNSVDLTGITNSNNIYIFNRNPIQTGIACKLYKFTLYDNDNEEYLRYYYPAQSISSGTIGLYDAVSKTFVTTGSATPFSHPEGTEPVHFEIGVFITSALGWIDSILNFAIAEPVIILFMAIGLAGAMFRWGRRLVHF